MAPCKANDLMHEPEEKGEHMDLTKFIERMREFRERVLAGVEGGRG